MSRHYNQIQDFFTSLENSNFERHDTAMDINHGLLVYSLLLSHKPENILELGIGTGYTSKAIVSAIKYNKMGKSTHVDSVDLWPPVGEAIQELRPILTEGSQIIIDTEEHFVNNCPENQYDFVLSDADHINAHTWFDKMLFLTKPDGILIFHDVTHFSYPNLFFLVEETKRLGLPHFVFNKNSKENEFCDRGLLVIRNVK